MSEEEYDILPRNSLEKLKADLDSIKKKTSGEGSENIIKSMEELKSSINNLLDMFKAASEDMKLEQAEQHGVEKKLAPLAKKVDMLIEQNQELAKGLVVIADMVKEHFPKLEHEMHDFISKKPKQDFREEKKRDEWKKNFDEQKPNNPAPRERIQETMHDFNPFGQQPDFSSQPPAFGTANSQQPRQMPQQRPAMPTTNMPPPGQPMFHDDPFGNLPPLDAPEPLGGIGDKPKKNDQGFFGKLIGKK